MLKKNTLLHRKQTSDGHRAGQQHKKANVSRQDCQCNV